MAGIPDGAERIVKKGDFLFDIGEGEITAQFQQEDCDLVPTDGEICVYPRAAHTQFVVAEQRPVRFHVYADRSRKSSSR